MNGMDGVAGLEMQMNNMFELHKQMTAGAVPNMNQFTMHSDLLPQQQAILNQQHLLSQQFAAQTPLPLSPMMAPVRARGRETKTDNRKRKRKDPNRPKRAMTPYFFFAAEYRNSLRREGKPVPGVKEVAQYCGPKWNSMPEEERRPFIESAERDRQRYLEEMNVYKKPRDEDKPKRPASAYFHFLVDFRKKMAGKPLPEHTTIPKLSGALWQKMTEEERRPYNQKMEEEKKVYELKLAEYRKMKADEAIKLAEKAPKAEGGYGDYGTGASAGGASATAPQLTMPQIPAEYTDINRQLQMMSNQMSAQNKALSWQEQFQSMQAAQVVQQHFNNYSSYYGGSQPSSSSSSSLAGAAAAAAGGGDPAAQLLQSLTPQNLAESAGGQASNSKVARSGSKSSNDEEEDEAKDDES